MIVFDVEHFIEFDKILDKNININLTGGNYEEKI
jgi:hypothetical protein